MIKYKEFEKNHLGLYHNKLIINHYQLLQFSNPFIIKSPHHQIKKSLRPVLHPTVLITSYGKTHMSAQSGRF